MKGSNSERELLRMFWAKGWACVRAAGSGAMRFPCPDLLASNGERSLSIECKSTAGRKRYIEAREVRELEKFSEKFGSEAWVGFRLNNIGWFFMRPSGLSESRGGNYSVDKNLAVRDGLRFDELIGVYRQKRLS